MVLKAVFPSQYIQGVRVLDELQSLIDKFGSKALLLASPSVLHGVLPKYEHLNLDSRLTKRKFGGECSMKEINGICSTILAEGIDIVIGMGGG
ncbi:MAG: iron-containing alcohol dehydrogenase, partial [Candidatus Cloacimonetes bacterium]|nr:iron-containing alcohol dehydrogenase [Candidatus Cloacimonadota bacterium]